MKNKKTLFAIIAVIAVLSLALVACSGSKGGGKLVKLVDFPATVTDEAQPLGDVYTLRRTVADEDGNSYPLSASVKTHVGGDVTVISGRFDLTDKDGYVVTYTAKVAENDIRTSVVTVPVYDATAPVIAITAPENGTVGELYTLPTITFSDDFAVTESSVKLYLVKGSDSEELEEIVLTESDGKYGFTPTEAGVYRIVATAKDAAGHETVRTADFYVDKPSLDGEIFNPASLTADSQLSSNKDPNTKYEFVSADDNTDKTYGGAYWKVEPAETGWVNIFLEPRLALSDYEEYDVITFWVYADGTAVGSTPTLVMLGQTASGGYNDNMTVGQWKLLEIDVTKFAEQIEKNVFFCSFNCKTEVTGIRIGEIMARKSVAFTISDPSVTDIVGDTPATATFTVTSDPADIKPVVTVTDASGKAVANPTVSGNQYSYNIDKAGTYTITVNAENSVYYGPATKEFEVKRNTRIEVEGDYPELTEEGVELDLLSAKVYSGGSEQSGVSVTLTVYRGSEEDDTWDSGATAVGTYTPSGLDDMKIVYSADGADDVEYIVKVVRAGEIFNPASEGARNQLTSNKAATFTYVSADENTDKTYGGAYWKIEPTDTSSWVNTSLVPKLALDSYSKYDIIAFWVYVDGTSSAGSFSLFLLGGTGDGIGGASYPGMTKGQWTLVEIDVDKFINNVKSKYFCSANYGSNNITGLYIGEIVARNKVKLEIKDLSVGDVDGDTPANVSFKISSDKVDPKYQNVSYTVSVTDASGKKIDATSTQNGECVYSIDKKGAYTITLTPESYVYYIPDATEEFYVFLAGTVFDPEYESAKDKPSQITMNVNSTFEFVPADENDNPTYDGAYWLIEPAAGTTWGNLSLIPRHKEDLSTYLNGYNAITFWVYVEPKGEAGTQKMDVLGKKGSWANGQYITHGKWTQVTITVSDFTSFVNTQYLFTLNYSIAIRVRIGAITANKSSD